MPVLAFRHVPFEHLGLIASALEARGIPFEYVDLFRDPAVAPPIDSAAGLIFMGGPMSANDDLPCIRKEIQLIGEAVRAGKPVLGVCLGAQLIAKALGAKVYRNRSKEIGWFPVCWTKAAHRDRLLEGLTEPETVFHWHGETFDLPPGAKWLAWSDACRHQAYRFGANVYGFQFHLEVTPEMISDWLTQDENCGDLRELAAPLDPYANAERLEQLSGLVFGRWAEFVTAEHGRPSLDANEFR